MEMTPRRQRWTRSRGPGTSEGIGWMAEGAADRPVQQHEEEVVETDLAKTSLRGPSQQRHSKRQIRWFNT